MPTNILNLSRLNVERVEDDEHDYHIYANSVVNPTTCPSCQSARLVGFGRNQQLIKDLPMHSKRVGIYFDTRRYRCNECNRTFLEQHPDFHPDRAMTLRLVNWIGQQSLHRTFSSLAEETGVVEGTIRNIFRNHANELEAQFRFEAPKWMGIDEIHLIRPRCVISNIQNNTIVHMLVNRNKDTVINYLSNLAGRHEVQYVAMDMWAPYRDAVQAVMPNAKIVIDKFHVARMANDALERVRKGLREQLTTKQRRGLMHDRFVLLKRERDLNDRERLLLDGWTANYPDLGVAYRLKEDFYGIYEKADSPQEAMKAYEAWSRAVAPQVRDAYSDLIRAWSNWQSWIINYFEHPVTNAYTESLNNLIRVMNRLGRGYSFEALRAKILFTEGAHRKTRARPKFERRREPADMGYGVPKNGVGFYLPPGHMGKMVDFGHQHETQGAEINFGAHIPTLIEMIESGRL